MAGFTGQVQFRGAHGRHHEAKDGLEDGPRDPRTADNNTRGSGRMRDELEAGGAAAGRLLRRLFRGNTDLRNARRRALFLLGVSTAKAGDAAPGRRLF